MRFRTTKWEPSASILRLGNHDLQVWRCYTDSSDLRVSRLIQLLSPDELIRAGRYVFERDRIQFVIARAFLRSVLGRYLLKSPKSLRFAYGPNGKPELSPNAYESTLGFNLAHAGKLAVCAVCRSKEVGVDIESLKLPQNEISNWESVLAESEMNAINSLPSGDRATALLSCWTRKESFLKSTGDGLQIPLNSIEVSVNPTDLPRMLSICGSREEAENWFMEAFTSEHGYVGAVVARGKDWNVQYRDFEFCERNLAGSPLTAA